MGLPEMESRTQGSRPRTQTNPRPRLRPRTTLPRTDPLEAKDKNARGQGQRPRTQAQVLSKKKRSSQKFFRRSLEKNIFQIFFPALNKILTIQKIVLSLRRGQANVRGLEASKPRPRTSKCVLEDVLEANDVQEDSISGVYLVSCSFCSLFK